MIDRLLSAEEVRARLRIGATTFRRILKRPDPPPSVRIAERKVLYPETGLEKWIESRRASKPGAPEAA